MTQEPVVEIGRLTDVDRGKQAAEKIADARGRMDAASYRASAKNVYAGLPFGHRCSVQLCESHVAPGAAIGEIGGNTLPCLLVGLPTVIHAEVSN